MEINKHFNRFDEIEHMPLKVFNRAVLSHNLLEDFGSYTVQEYFNLFKEWEKKQIFLMNMIIKKYGADKAREMATEDLELPDETS